MSCSQINREDVAERYLMGSLAPQERESFEDHYFDCEECFALLQARRALQAELSANAAQLLESLRNTIRTSSPPDKVWRWGWAIGLTVILMSVGSLLWLRRPATQPPASSQVSIVRQQESTKASKAPTSQTDQTAAQITRQNSLKELARVQPPPYEPNLLRGTIDQATEKFRDGMRDYVHGDYQEAASKLRVAAKIDAQSPRIQFFLGASELLIGEDDKAIRSLQAAAALGDSPYLEEAHFYLAKGWLRKQQLVAAQQELEKTIRLQGDLEQQARGLLRQLEVLEPTSP